MIKTIKLTLLFIFALAGFLIATLPVNYLLPFIPKSVPIKVQGADGTVWKGAATDVSWKRQSIGKVEWKIYPLSLFLLRLKTDFELSGTGIHADGNAVIKRDQSIVLRNTFVDGDIASLPLPTQNMMVVPEGKINATIRSLTILEQKPHAADADILWQSAKITSPAVVDLGQVSLNVTGKDGAFDGKLDSKDGAIKANGKLSVNSTGLLNANIKLSPDTKAPPDIKDILSMLGKTDRTGAVTIRQKLKIPNWPS